jgi:HlyD family secretion protein
MSNTLPAIITSRQPALWFNDVPRSGRAATVAGYLTMLVALGGFGAWASTAPIDGAVLAPGVFVATSQNKIVQHLEGGIIREISVREGEVVEKGQRLVRLDDTAAKAELRRLQLRRYQLMTTVERLKAESERQTQFTAPKEIVEVSAQDVDVQPILTSQRAIFVARLERLSSDIGIQQKTAATFRHRINGDATRRKSLQDQLALVREDLAGKATLFEKGLLRKSEYLTLRRLETNLVGEVERLVSEIRDSDERIAAAEMQIARLKTVAVQTALEEMHTANGELKDVQERITTAKNLLARLDINAPVAGTVVKLNYHTNSGVIRAGNDILALLPKDDELVIEVRVRAQDIDHVKVGLESIVRLTTMNQRLTPMVPGKVTYVSADALPNERKVSEDNGFIARIQLDGAKAAEVVGFSPTPGMPVEVYIKTGDRTFLKYLLQPLFDTMARAFRER